MNQTFKSLANDDFSPTYFLNFFSYNLLKASAYFKKIFFVLGEKKKLLKLILASNDGLAMTESPKKRMELLQNHLQELQPSGWAKRDRNLDNHRYNGFRKRMEKYLSSLQIRCDFYALKRGGKFRR